MGEIVALLATAAAMLFAVWPLIKNAATSEADRAQELELLSQRDLALNDIREADFDHDLGNLSEDDYRDLRDRYKRRAVTILKQLNAQENQLDDEIERAVAALRRPLSTQP